SSDLLAQTAAERVATESRRIRGLEQTATRPCDTTGVNGALSGRYFEAAGFDSTRFGALAGLRAFEKLGEQRHRMVIRRATHTAREMKTRFIALTTTRELPRLANANVGALRIKQRSAS